MKTAFLLVLGLAVQILLTPLAAAALSVAVISDINGRYGSTGYDQRVAQAIERIIVMAPDLVICTGDMVAGQRPSPKLSRAELASMWRSFHRLIRAPLESAGIAVIMSPGNHDASAYPGFSLERQSYLNYHTQHPPTLQPLPGHNYPFHYALAHQELLFVSLDATVTGPIPNPQREWLAGILAQSERYRGVFLFGHLPLQPVSVGRERDIISDPELEKLMHGAQVSAYLSGHHHAYYPGRRNGISMLSIGNLGGNQRPLTGTDTRTGFSFVWMEIQPDGTFTVEAYTGDDFEELLARDSLPARLGRGKRALYRMDLAPH